MEPYCVGRSVPSGAWVCGRFWNTHPTSTGPASSDWAWKSILTQQVLDPDYYGMVLSLLQPCYEELERLHHTPLPFATWAAVLAQFLLRHTPCRCRGVGKTDRTLRFPIAVSDSHLDGGGPPVYRSPIVCIFPAFSVSSGPTGNLWSWIPMPLSFRGCIPKAGTICLC